MSEGPQYTSCTDKSKWESAISHVGVANIGLAVAAIVLILSGFAPIGAILAIASAAEILRKVAEWQLTLKLICLANVKRRVYSDPDTDRICVVGTVLDFEGVGEDKSGFETIDNDFGLNLFIAPFAISDVAAIEHGVLKKQMERSAQGDLIQNPDAPEPTPGDPNPEPGPLKRKDDPSQNFGPMPAGFTGYQRGLMFSKSLAKSVPTNAYRDPHELVKVDPKLKQLGDDAYADFVAKYKGVVIHNGQPMPQNIKDAILADAAKDPLGHSEVSKAFYDAVEKAFHFEEKQAQALHCEFEGSRIKDVFDVLDFAHVECDSDGFWGFLCDVLNYVISILLGLPKLIAAIAAWALAKDGKLSDAYDGNGGEIKWGDPIVVRGRWVYDSGHSGYNEMHAVRTVQKTLLPQDRDLWCSELAKVPPIPPADTPGAPPPMTPGQQRTHDAQNRDENRWVYHPAIDGCLPVAVDEPPPLH